jgi:hypothetical protein
MSNEPESLGEVARLVRALQNSSDKQFNAMNTRLDRLVSAEVYQIHVGAIDKRIDGLTQALADETAERKAAVTAEAGKRTEAARNTGTWIRGLLFAMLVPVGLWIATLVANASG